ARGNGCWGRPWLHRAVLPLRYVGGGRVLGKTAREMVVWGGRGYTAPSCPYEYVGGGRVLGKTAREMVVRGGRGYIAPSCPYDIQPSDIHSLFIVSNDSYPGFGRKRHSFWSVAW
ncbi:MAG: hypothetical protein GY803_06995, partial [Chloroflexi bacterium]|nr:hypothetical protein [Chloroflexota bacterium]